MQSISQSLRQNNNSSNDQRQEYQQLLFNRNFQQSRVYYSKNKKNQKNIFLIEKKYQNDYYEQKWSNTLIDENDFYDNENSSNRFLLDESNSFFVKTLTKLTKTYICRRCSKEFYFNNKLHNHLKLYQTMTTKQIVIETIDVFNVVIIQFDASSNNQSNLEFRFWRYVIFATFINKSNSFNELCCDINYEASLVNREFLAIEMSNFQRHIQKKFIVMKIREINDVVLNITKHLFVSFRVSRLIDDKSIIVCFTRQVYIVDDLKTKLLLSNDIIDSKNIVSNIEKKKITINSCKNLIIKFNVKNADSIIKRVTRASNVTTIFVKSSTAILFKLREKEALSINRDFMFVSQRIDRLRNENDVLSHIIDVNTIVVLMQNVNFEDVFLLKFNKLDIIQDYEEKNCFFANSKKIVLTINFDCHKSTSRKNWLKRVIKTNVIVLIVKTIVVIFFQNTTKSNIFSIKKLVTQIEITIYDENFVIQTQIADVTKIYSQLWQDNEAIVRISSKKWMSINIFFDVKMKTIKIYSLKSTNREFVDEIFDKLYTQDRMKYITQSTSHDYSIFVVWRIVFDFDESKKKSRVVINIRELNKILIIDSYSMSLQSNIIFFVIDCLYISIFDAIEFFHQWLIRLTNRHKLIVVFHRSQKQFNVIVMSFKNSSFYVQRKIDVIFRAYRVFARVYVDDIVVFNHTLKKHLAHLHTIFQLFDFYDINLSSKKFFLDYLIVVLLKQKINVFDFITIIDKLKTIVKLNFSYILKNLKIYLDLIDWLREFVLWYAQKINVLQRRKTLLLKQSSSNKDTTRKIFSRKIVVENSIIDELKSYRQLQTSFNQITFLIHVFNERTFYIDIDVFKRREFEVMIYHLKIICLNSKESKRIDIELILFLSRMLNDIKTKY